MWRSLSSPVSSVEGGAESLTLIRMLCLLARSVEVKVLLP